MSLHGDLLRQARHLATKEPRRPLQASLRRAVEAAYYSLSKHHGDVMRSTIEIGGYRAIVQYDPEINMFRGDFVGLNGGADFYAKDIVGLRKEGALSLNVFLEMCREDSVNPRT